MNFKKMAFDQIQTQQARESGAASTIRELSIEDLQQVAGGGIILSEMKVPPGTETNGIILSE